MRKEGDRDGARRCSFLVYRGKYVKGKNKAWFAAMTFPGLRLPYSGRTKTNRLVVQPSPTCSHYALELCVSTLPFDFSSWVRCALTLVARPVAAPFSQRTRTRTTDQSASSDPEDEQRVGANAFRRLPPPPGHCRCDNQPPCLSATQPSARRALHAVCRGRHHFVRL